MLTQTRLKELLHYNPDTGIFMHKVGSPYKTKGAIAGTFNQRYFKMKLDCEHYVMHRLAWLYMTGEYPEFEIDHRDGDGTNNSWTNLRSATRSQNCSNRATHKNNKSGVKGVSWMKRNKKWIAYVSLNKKIHYLGLFLNIDDAKEAVRLKRIELHGEFSNHG